METIKIDEQLILCGDIHGEIEELREDIYLMRLGLPKEKKLNVLLLGDIGFGFGSQSQEENFAVREIKFADICEDFNVRFYFLRGNHDNPYAWDKNRKSMYGDYYFTFLQDGDIIEHNGKRYLCCGGGVSIDKIYRKEGISYWKNEEIEFVDYKEISTVDGILAHTGPVPPNNGTRALEYYCGLDPDIKCLVAKEQETVKKIIDRYKPNTWYYGHFHPPFTKEFEHDGMNCCCLACNRFYNLTNPISYVH